MVSSRVASERDVVRRRLGLHEGPGRGADLLHRHALRGQEAERAKADNPTLLGSVANVIDFELAKEQVGFVEYLKVGVPLTVASTGLALGLLRLVG